MRIERNSEDTITVYLGTDVDKVTNSLLVQLKHLVNSWQLEYIIEVILSYTSATIHFDVLTCDDSELMSRLQSIDIEDLTNNDPTYKIIEIPVCYNESFGPDIERFVADDIPRDELIERHSDKDYLVYMLGFMPGFPYLGGLDTKIYKDRLDNPRTNIPAGSVGIGGMQTGMYPFESPGGWNIIGRTPVPLYDSNRDEPILYAAGDRIRYKQISEEEYYSIEEAYRKGLYRVKTYLGGKEHGN